MQLLYHDYFLFSDILFHTYLWYGAEGWHNLDKGVVPGTWSGDGGAAIRKSATGVSSSRRERGEVAGQVTSRNVG